MSAGSQPIVSLLGAASLSKVSGAAVQDVFEGDDPVGPPVAVPALADVVPDTAIEPVVSPVTEEIVVAGAAGSAPSPELWSRALGRRCASAIKR